MDMDLNAMPDLDELEDFEVGHNQDKEIHFDCSEKKYLSTRLDSDVLRLDIVDIESDSNDCYGELPHADVDTAKGKRISASVYLKRGAHKRIDEDGPSTGSKNPCVGGDGSSGKTNPMIRDIEERLQVGSVMKDLEQAYLIYCEYGRCKGFGVRRGEQRYFGQSKDIKWKKYVCSCAEAPESNRTRGRVPAFKKLLVRTGCTAKIKLSRRINEPWRVTIFNIEHNHDLVPSEQTYMLRSSRNLSYAKQSILEALHSAGIGVSGACTFMERECGGPQNLGFTRRDAYDHLKEKKKKTKLENGDATALLEYFINKSNEEPFFYWNVQLDDEHRIMNIFYRDSRCASDYRAFGDVLSVDTTHRTNKYNLVCAPFVGINHHTQNVMFGMAFLSDETTSSFEWLFAAFLESMNGAQPKVIFTDQCKAMMNAIDKVFPNSKHRLCQWHINRNASGKFGSLNGNSMFKKMWYKCMNEVETEEEFEEVWKLLIQCQDLKCKNWLNNMYDIRHRWASVFSRGIFTGGLLATSRSEGTNRVLKNLQKSSNTLYEFVCNFEAIQIRWRRKEKEEDTLGIWKPGQLVTNNELFVQAASTYTRNVYRWFEYEATKSFSVVISHEFVDLGDGRIEICSSSRSGGRDRKIIFNKVTSVASCSCRMWEVQGTFCRHIFKVYYVMNVFTIPESQILKRWTKRAKDGSCVDICVTENRTTLPFMLFVNTVMRQLYDMASSCLENEAGRSIIIERLEDIRREVFEVVGMPEVKIKKKVVSLSNAHGDGTFVRDPEPILDKVFNHARNLRRLNGDIIKGWKKPRKLYTMPMPKVSEQYIHPVTATSGPGKKTDQSPGNVFGEGPNFLFSRSQP